MENAAVGECNGPAGGVVALVAVRANPENGAMPDEDHSDQPVRGSAGDALARLRARVLARWREFPDSRRDELDTLLADALVRAAAADPEVLTVMDPAARPQRLRLAPVAERAYLDSFYHNEWAELAVSHDGRLFLVYRRRDGGDYAVTWSQATTVPAPIMQALPDVLAFAMLEDDGSEG